MEWNWKFSFARDYTNPHATAKRNSKTPPEVVLDQSNLTPMRVWNPSSTSSDTKLLFVTRHGSAAHNLKSAKYGQALYYEFFAQDPNDIDPALSPEGVAQARMVGSIMKNTDLPLPTSYCSSPLRRCVLTAVHALAELHGPPAAQHPIRVKEGLREWLGWEHGHSSDRRSTRTEIQNFAKNAGGRVLMDDSFPEEDEMVRNGTKETYEDVRARIQRTLIDIYDTDSAKVIHLFLHNRCFHSFLSMIGHSEEEEFDLQNCATLVFLVTRERLNQEQAAEQQRRHEMAKVKEEAAIRKAKAELSAAAQKLVREMDGKQASEVYGELTSDEDRMKWDSWRR